jgi:hypothetical protein
VDWKNLPEYHKITLHMMVSCRFFESNEEDDQVSNWLLFYTLALGQMNKMFPVCFLCTFINKNDYISIVARSNT